MRSVKVKKGSRFLILNGPPLIEIEHALFESIKRDGTPKKVLFDFKFIEPSQEDYIQKFDNFSSDGTVEVEIIAVRKLNPLIQEDGWTLWCKNGRHETVICYSTATRLGCGKYSVFPEY